MAMACAIPTALVAGEPPRPIDFNREVRPILSNACFHCHGPDAHARKGLAKPLRLDTEEGARADLGGHAAIVPGKPDESEALRRVASDDATEVMPPPSLHKKLTDREIETLTRWVGQGAPYARHWSYARPARPGLPEVRDKAWPRNPIDRFVLARLESEGLKPAPEADRRALIRRLSLDLTGLPPTPEEADRFATDPAADAYEKLVDQLLARPSYGEHWGKMWLDLARYADSAGYADDPARTIWAYRDYVIRSFNANMPFDRFTIEQVAGDLLPGPTEDQLVATAFHRNTLTNNEGGTNDEEFRNVAVVDRVNTTMAVWMGTTIACAQCHDHKYDPLTQKEYFQLFAFFNNTQDADRGDEGPLLSLYNEAQKRDKLATEGEIATREAVLQASPPGQADEAIAAEWQEMRDRLVALKQHLAEAKPETTVPIFRETAAGTRRKTNVQVRGNFLDLDAEVSEGVPSVFPPLPSGVPIDRLALARWLVDGANPLTARVVANRHWETIFGTGLVATSEEFGAQGDQPSHPELLDWLATELVRDGWDLKKLARLLVTSAAYRQSSRVTPDDYQRDPDNRLLARGPRFRLPAETIRDQALFMGGLLSPKMYGPPVKPPQPSTGLAAAFGSGIDWETSRGEDRYRRGLYTTWRRSNPYPSMATFDAPNRETCTVRRSRTNTPLQALVTLNDPVYIEAAQGLARRMLNAGPEPTKKAKHGFRLCLARDPNDEELRRIVQLFEETRSKLASDREKATKIATDPLGPIPPGADVVELAAWTVVGNVLLNLDETLMKR